MAYIFEQGEWRANNREKTSLKSLTQNRARAFYFYNLEDALERARAFVKNPVRAHYAMKANAHPRLLRGFQSLGLGVDVVSLGEMEKALRLGFDPKKIIFSGVGKDREDLEAAISRRILQINVESFEELQALEAICQEKKTDIEIALRLNIHLTAPTHKHVQTSTPESKFGLDLRLLPEVLQWLKGGRRVKLKSLTVHIGSQIMDISIFEQMGREMGKIFRDVRAQGFALERLDLGGGLGIDYQTSGEEDLGRLEEYMGKLLPAHGTGAEVILEPGRFLVARMGVLLAKVIYVKKTLDRQFLILNAGMNALMRPALYQSYHRIQPVAPYSPDEETYTVVGPICESTDVFADQRTMQRTAPGEWVAIFDAGAYGAVMANTYNESAMPEQWTSYNGTLEVL